MILAVVVLPVLAFAGVPLVTMGSAYFIETHSTSHSVHFHWSLSIIACVFLFGVALIVFSRREKASYTDLRKD